MVEKLGRTSVLLIIAGFFTACTQQEFVDSTRTALKKSCENARNCTVHDETGER